MSRKVGWGLAFLIGIGGARAQAPKPKATLTGHESSIIALAFSPDGKTLAVVDRCGQTVVWDMAKRVVKARLHGIASTVPALSFTADAKTLAAAGQGGQLLFWDTAHWDEPTDVETGARHVTCAAFARDGSVVALATKAHTITLL